MRKDYIVVMVWCGRGISPLPQHVWVFGKMPPASKGQVISISVYGVPFKQPTKIQRYVLNETTIHAFLPHLRQDLLQKLNLLQRADYYRVALLSRYGGIWLDQTLSLYVI